MADMQTKGLILVVGFGKPFEMKDKETGELVPMMELSFVQASGEKDRIGFQSVSKFLTRDIVKLFQAANKGIGYYEVIYDWRMNKKMEAKAVFAGFEFKKLMALEQLR